MFDVIMTSLPHVKSGKLRTLGLSSLKRSPITPDVPTIAESGYPNFEAMVWFGQFAPANTPVDVVRKINEDTARALQSPKMRELLSAQGLEVVAGSPADFSRRVAAEIAKWRKVISEAGIKLDY
jgi:tripartite-type tricarboxylate transporter receptor subunit TctC